MATPDNPIPPPTSMNRDIGDLRATVEKLEAEHRARGVQLSGRIVHVAHYLPVIGSLSSRPASILSPPKTPELGRPSSPTPSGPTWGLRSRHGHDAMFSGIRSLADDYEQVIVGWIGDLEAGPQKERVATASLADEEKEALELAVSQYSDPEVSVGKKGITYVPVWIDDKVAHGHYDGFSKAGESQTGLHRISSAGGLSPHSPLAAVPLFVMARCRT